MVKGNGIVLTQLLQEWLLVCGLAQAAQKLFFLMTAFYSIPLFGCTVMYLVSSLLIVIYVV